MWRLGVVLFAGCDLVFPLKDPPIDERFAECRDPELRWGPADLDHVSDAFDKFADAISEPTQIGDTMLYRASRAGFPDEISYARFSSTEDRFVHMGVTAGPGMFTPSTRPQLWVDDAGQARLFFSGTELNAPAPQPFEGFPLDEMGIAWNPDKISLPATLRDLGVVFFGTPGLAGTRIILEVEATGELIELERSELNEFVELDTTSLITPPARNPRMAEDGCWMIFSQPDPAGVHDLMISVRRPDGTFGTPGLLTGTTPTIDEQDPFVASDGMSLVFSQTDQGTPAVLRQLFRRPREI